MHGGSWSISVSVSVSVKSSIQRSRSRADHQLALCPRWGQCLAGCRAHSGCHPGGVGVAGGSCGVVIRGPSLGII